MEFQDLKNKFKLRKLSEREKILLTVFLLLITQFIFYYFLIRPKKVSFENLKSLEQNDKITVDKKPYIGLKDFGEDSLKNFINSNNLSADNIRKSTNHEIESLDVNKKVKLDEFSNMGKLCNYYGFSRIDLHRENKEQFNLALRAEKASKIILYKDIRDEYFKDDNKESLPDTAEIKSQVERIDDSTKKSKDNKNPQVKKDITKNNQSAKPQTFKTEKILNDKAKAKSTIENNVEKLVVPSVEEIEKLKFDPFSIDLENLKVEGYNATSTYFKDIYTLAIYFEPVENEILKIDLGQKESNISFEILKPVDSELKLGIITEDGQYIEYEDPLKEENSFESSSWEKIEFKSDGILSIFLQDSSPQEKVIFIRNLRKVSNEI